MSEALHLSLALIVGFFLGGVYFGGLWWTIQKMISSKGAGFWLLGSLWLRSGFTLLGFYFVSEGQWQRLLMSLLGFLMARSFIKLLLRISKKPARQMSEAPHAPKPG